jgi:hypothetical protein
MRFKNVGSGPTPARHTHGALGEVFVSTDTHGLFVQDGATIGGFTPNGTSPARAAAAVDATTNTSHGGMSQFACQEQLISGLSGATVVSTIAIPIGAIVLGVSVRVTTAITGAAFFWVDPTTDINGGGAFTAVGKYGGVAGSLNTTNPGLAAPQASFFSSTITLTGRTAASGGSAASFTAGAVRIQLNYILLNPPTS